MKIGQKATVGLELVLVLSESEARALEAISGYDEEAVIKSFYSVCGKHHLQPHEEGMKTLLKTIRVEVPPILSRLDEARKVFNLPAKESK